MPPPLRGSKHAQPTVCTDGSTSTSTSHIDCPTSKRTNRQDAIFACRIPSSRPTGSALILQQSILYNLVLSILVCLNRLQYYLIASMYRTVYCCIALYIGQQQWRQKYVSAKKRRQAAGGLIQCPSRRRPLSSSRQDRAANITNTAYSTHGAFENGLMYIPVFIHVEQKSKVHRTRRATTC